jgi:cyanophycinase
MVAWCVLGVVLAVAAWFGPGLAFQKGAGVSASAAALPAKPPGGSLVIVGGGKVTDEVRDRFVSLAGGKTANIVVIPTGHRWAATPQAETLLERWKSVDIASVRLLHARTRQEADTPEFVRPLKEATGVWISGGVQTALAEAYRGTEVERQLVALLDRGGVIGGTSAGAAVMSRVMIAGGRGEARLGEGLNLLPGVVLDQHFIKRNRMNRLQEVVRTHPDLLGIGVDESTALVVDVKRNRGRVLGLSAVVTCVVPPGTTAPHIEFLKAGDEADLTALKTVAGGAVSASIDLDTN